MAAHQAPRSLGFSRQEHWSGLPFPSPMLKRTIRPSIISQAGAEVNDTHMSLIFSHGNFFPEPQMPSVTCPPVTPASPLIPSHLCAQTCWPPPPPKHLKLIALWEPLFWWFSPPDILISLVFTGWAASQHSGLSSEKPI